MRAFLCVMIGCLTLSPLFSAPAEANALFVAKREPVEPTSVGDSDGAEWGSYPINGRVRVGASISYEGELLMYAWTPEYATFQNAAFCELVLNATAGVSVDSLRTSSHQWDWQVRWPDGIPEDGGRAWSEESHSESVVLRRAGETAIRIQFAPSSDITIGGQAKSNHAGYAAEPTLPDRSFHCPATFTL